MSFEARIISAIALMYSFFGVYQYVTTEVFIAPFLLNAFILFIVANLFFVKHLVQYKKWSNGLFFFAAFTSINLINDQWFMGMMLNYSDLSEWFNSSTYYLVQVIGIVSLTASLVVLIILSKQLHRYYFWLYTILSAIFGVSLFFETHLPPEIIVFAIGGLSLVTNYRYFEKPQIPNQLFNLNSLWFLLALLNFFEFLSLGI